MLPNVTMSRSLRIAVLECDTPIDWVKTHYGTYGDRFATLMETTLPRCSDGKLQLSATVAKYDAVGERYPALHDLDGILITGSSSLHKKAVYIDFQLILNRIRRVCRHGLDPKSHQVCSICVQGSYTYCGGMLRPSDNCSCNGCQRRQEFQRMGDLSQHCESHRSRVSHFWQGEIGTCQATANLVLGTT